VASPRRGEVFLVDLNPTRGHEQAGRRPALVVSADAFNRSRAGLVFVVPLTTRARGIPTHVEVRPPEGGLHETSWARCEDLRSISTERLMGGPLGVVPAEVLDAIGERLRLLLQL
jgi:mRNA interferase MazF